MNKRLRHIAICAAITVGAVIVTRLLSDVRFFSILNLKALDAHFVLRGERPTSDVMLIVNDRKALDTFTDVQLFWHPYYASAIRAAGQGGAKVIGLDVAFGVPVDRWEPEHDSLLSAAVSGSPVPVVVGYAPSLTTVPVPVNMIAAAFGNAAFVNITADLDDFVRRQELIEAPREDGSMPTRSLALRAVERFFGEDAVYENGRLSLAGREIPVARDRSIFINYAGQEGTFPRVSIADVYAAEQRSDAAQLKQWFDGKLVLLGTDADFDRFGTPFFTLLGEGKWNTSGVEIHANTAHTLLRQDYLLPAPDWARYLAMLLACAVTVAVAAGLRAQAAAAGIIGIGLTVVAVTHVAFLANTMLSTSETMVAATFALVPAVIYRFASAERRRALFHEAMSKFVSHKVAAALDEHQTIGLSGKRDTVTILFTDIRGFTAYTEKVCDEQGPEYLVNKLNGYMATMAAIIVAYGGHVNKYIGDGILAVFSDEDEGAKPGDHALRGVQCATRMVTAPSEFKTGAGLHTGLVVVGNVGSADKMEYTVLGDTVNLASRLESLNKEHKTRLLMSETTQEMLNGAVETKLLGSVPVRGKAEPINLYTVQSLVPEEVHA